MAEVEVAAAGKKRTLDETQPESVEPSNGAKKAHTGAEQETDSKNEEAKGEQTSKEEPAKPFFSFNFTSPATTSSTTPSIFGGFSTPLFSFSKPIGENGGGEAAKNNVFDFKFPSGSGDKESAWSTFSSIPKGTPAFSDSTKDPNEKVYVAPVQTLTGEENEKRVHSVKGKLYLWSQSEKRWKERGEGKLHINVLKENEKEARLVMRMEAAFRLILNAKIFAQMRCEKASDKTISITAVGGVDEPDLVDKLNTFMVKLSRKDETEELVEQLQKYIKLSEDLKPKESTEKPAKEEKETNAEEQKKESEDKTTNKE